MALGSHLRALLTKNWVLWRRNSLGSFMEIAVPIFFALLFLVFRHAQPTTIQRRTSYFSSPYIFTGDLSTASPFMKNCSVERGGGYIAIAPPDDSILQQLIDLGVLDTTAEVMTFANNDAIDEFTQRAEYATENNRLCLAIVMQKNDPVNHQYQYLLRYNISARDGEDIPSTNQDRVRKIQPEDQISLLKYATSGFLTLQTWIDTLILRSATADDTAEIDASVASVTVPAHRRDDLILTLFGTPQYFIVMPLILPFLRMVNGILKEKEKRIREGMRIMGLHNAAFYLSWFITYFFIMSLLSLSIATILTLGFFINSSLGHLFLWHWEYSICLISFGMLITVFFSRVKVGNIVAFLIVFLLEWVEQLVNDSDTTPEARFWASIAFPTSVALGANHILSLEASQIGLKAINANTLFLNYKMTYHYMWMAIETVVFILLTVYLDQILPTQFGTRKHPLFCLRRTKKKKIPKKAITEEALDNHSLLEDNENFEETDPALIAQDKSDESIKIKNLKKIYSNGKLAVDGVSYNMYKGQIFVLLGHNGAGKTTTISMITGLYPPTEGNVEAFGIDIANNLDTVRSIMGVCPQHDVLFDDLTVKEHLELFAIFKGMSQRDIPAEIDKLINDLDLAEKRDYLTKNLSGGQRRRLSIAIAFVGGSKFILLDEPSSGMDTSARRRLWDMLKNYKHGRVVLLTTHYMDEADYLGDRIGIMGDGKMQCLGRPLFLKNRFGVGYTLTLSKKDSKEDSRKMVKFIEGFIPEAKVMTDVSLEVTLQLPLETVHKFQDLFESLDQNLKKLGIETYGVSVTTLEQVFLNVARMTAKSDRETSSTNELLTKSFRKEDIDNFDLREERINNPWALFLTQFFALILKRINYHRRDKKGLLVEMFFPVILIIAGILITKADVIPAVKNVTLADNLYPNFNVRYGEPPPTFINEFATTAFNRISIPTATNMSLLDTAVFANRTLDREFSKFNFLADNTNVATLQYNYSVLVDTRAQEASAFAFNKINTAILRSATGSNNSYIEVVVAPFKHTSGVKSIENAIDGLSISFVFSIAMSIIPACIVTFIVKERELTVKHQQLISGISIQAYWFSNYFIDILKYAIPGVLNCIMAIAFDAEGLIKGEKLGVLWALFLVYGFSATSFSYLTSFLFRDFGIAQTTTFFFHFGSGFIGGLACGLLRIFEATNHVPHVLQWIFRPLPTFALTYGLLNLTNREIYQRIEKDTYLRSPWNLDLSGGDVLYMAISALIYFLAIFLIEFLRTKRIVLPEIPIKALRPNKPVSAPPKYIDVDVPKEIERVETTPAKEFSIKVDKLRKVYHMNKERQKVAVNQISFGVQNGDCFALLGVNGAGKTTCFKMLTGEIPPTSGKSFINGYEIPNQLSHARHDIGYCPQNDPLLENLTPKEHLYLYSAIRGIPSDKRKRIVEKQLRDMKLVEYANVPAGALSGGNKRKLTVAIAMVGNPPIVFLDEPSTGMDPEARRFIWDVISRISRERKKSSVILTTHSMEEAEALSTRIGIMVDGVLVCLGSAQHIKSKYGGGFEVEIKLNLVPKKKVHESIKALGYELNALLTKSQIDAVLKDTGAPYLSRQISEQGSGSPIFLELKKGKVAIDFVMDWILIEKSGGKLKEFLEKTFDGAVMIEHFQSFYRFTISSNVGIGQIFGKLEENKATLNIMQYSVRQSTIEQIFNMFASDHSHSMAKRKLENYKNRTKQKEIAMSFNEQNQELHGNRPASRLISVKTMEEPLKPANSVINLDECP